MLARPSRRAGRQARLALAQQRTICSTWHRGVASCQLSSSSHRRPIHQHDVACMHGGAGPAAARPTPAYAHPACAPARRQACSRA
ncbi:hypothetical protein PsYK624_083740 [Phanerochaete sordida]|uniref:Uncharacterized protein n=1 Tax=Phanerochaete sordida TaxID=48140 RepID=A0A9P3GCG5_9APHY|nr:hypothetical protein PsYK624_083740 [Phanerochaete sordida]